MVLAAIASVVAVGAWARRRSARPTLRNCHIQKRMNSEHTHCYHSDGLFYYLEEL
jgi:hypothetical protein